MAERETGLVTTVTHGPGLRAPFAAVIAEFDVPDASTIDNTAIIAGLASCLPEPLCERLAAGERSPTLPHWVARFAHAITEAHGIMSLPAAHGVITGQRPSRGWVALGYYDAPATAQALRFAVAASNISNLSTDAAALRSQAERTLRMQVARQPDFQARAMMRAAGQRGIPVISVAGGSRIWQYGHGSKAWQCFETSTHADARTGDMLQRNKIQSNEVVRRLGLPGVEHGTAMTPQQAITLGKQLGFPLVVKPLNRGQGRGVTVGVRTPDEITAAFRLAASFSRQVIVERFVAGDDYRIVVAGGKFQWAIRRMPPQVVGDGKSSLAELIEQKNARIPLGEIKKGFLKRIVLDGELHRMLAMQQITLEGCPAIGETIRLRGNANVSSGGSFVDVSAEIHPDNITMAETIARAFRLDCVGVDFLTPDISRSWREVGGTVIEVNTTPGLLTDAQAAKLLQSKFADGTNGRIPAMLVLCESPAIKNRLFASLATVGHGIGVLTSTAVRLNGETRRTGAALDAGSAAQALLLDPACEALVAICTIDEVRQGGLPLDRLTIGAWTENSQPDPAVLDLLRLVCDKTKSVTETGVAAALKEL